MKDFINDFIESYNNSYISLIILNFMFGLSGFILGNITYKITKYLNNKIQTFLFYLHNLVLN